jgi:hypothetical protein
MPRPRVKPTQRGEQLRYESNQQEKKQKSDLAHGKVTAGLQMVGVNCELIGKSPNPKDGLTWITGA